MAPLDKAMFSGNLSISTDELEKLEVLNHAEAVDEALKRFKWNCRTTGCIVLQLSADNREAAAGQFLARGRLAREEIKVEASKIWAGAEAGLTLSIQVPDSRRFKFNDGGLCSDFMDMEEVEHCVTTGGRNGQVVMHEEYESRGIGAFCLRLVCHLSRASQKAGVTLAFTVMMFPGKAEEVMDTSELTRSPGWPGLKVCEGDMQLLPTPTSPWGCPVLPLLRTGAPWGDTPITPTMEAMKDKIGWIMATSEPPEVCKTRKALMAKWQKYANSPDDFSPKKGPLSWPRPQQSRNTGRASCFYAIHLNHSTQYIDVTLYKM